MSLMWYGKSWFETKKMSWAKPRIKTGKILAHYKKILRQNFGNRATFGSFDQSFHIICRFPVEGAPSFLNFA